MKLFVDSASVTEIEDCLSRGAACGVTTNPSLLKGGDVGPVLTVADECGGPPVSVEAVGRTPAATMADALRLLEHHGGYPRLYVKVPIGWDYLPIIRRVVEDGGQVNVTACMSYGQAIMGANAGAAYVSLFWGRIRDIGYDAASVVRQVRETFEDNGSSCQIIVGSIRQVADVSEAIAAGAHVVTVPPKFLPQMCSHPKTDEVVAQFMADAGLG